MPLSRFVLSKNLLLVFAISWVSAISCFAIEDLNVDDLQSQIMTAVEKVVPASVAINDGGMVFSGVIVSSDGIVLSAGHAVKPNRRYKVLLADGRELRAKGLGANERVDMAMLKIENPSSLPVAELGDSNSLLINQPCISISFPGTYVKDRGSVIRLGYVTRPVTPNQGMIETTAVMEPGDSGGPLVDINGRVIGIHSNIRKDTKQNYDVPINSFKKYWEQLKTPKFFEINGWPSLPKLGFRGESDSNGLKVVKIVDGGLAQASGLKVNDVVQAISGRKVNSSNSIYYKLVSLRNSGESQVEFSVLRNQKRKLIKLNLTEEEVLEKPKTFPELRDFSKVFKSLEAKLDNAQVVIKSRLDEQSQTVWGTRIFRKGRGNLISKSTLVGTEPRVQLGNGSSLAAEVVARDPKNDLVLLQVDFRDVGGIDLSRIKGDLAEQPGRLLLMPDAEGDGSISTWGSNFFAVPRTRASGGYLGVVIGSRDNKVVFEEVQDGAAKKAGLEAGDVVLKLDDKSVRQRNDVFRFLSNQDVNNRIDVTVRRDGEEITKQVILGKRPAKKSRHIADDFDGGKSVRRDGFSRVVSHDADLRPEQCGGPVFDIDGNFLGVNISRFSRTRAYVIPRTVIKEFIDQNAS
ncbi:MAG: PDZ domain-containing protein [Planctomycetaceae bacterium]|nr:PDZ domain-containing protein [Planctomycetaceae bacterium]